MLYAKRKVTIIEADGMKKLRELQSRFLCKQLFTRASLFNTIGFKKTGELLAGELQYCTFFMQILTSFLGNVSLNLFFFESDDCWPIKLEIEGTIPIIILVSMTYGAED